MKIIVKEVDGNLAVFIENSPRAGDHRTIVFFQPTVGMRAVV